LQGKLWLSNVTVLIDPDHAAINSHLATIPEQFRHDIEVWIRVQRGQGRRRHPERRWSLIRRYVRQVAPVLNSWSHKHHNFRSVTTLDIEEAVKADTGGWPRGRQVALRWLFAALKQERLIFRDPARCVSLRLAGRLPVPLPSDRLRGLLDKASGPAARLAVALVAVHALGAQELRGLLLEDLDRPNGRLVVRRPTREHTVILDELTSVIIAEWLHERFRRWPHTTNPHLLVTQRTANDTRQIPISKCAVVEYFQPLAATPRQLRIDRLLDEAAHTADPLHLMRVFGIGAATALKYVRAAHPERFNVDPTAP
jgi:integrase